MALVTALSEIADLAGKVPCILGQVGRTPILSARQFLARLQDSTAGEKSQ